MTATVTEEVPEWVQKFVKELLWELDIDNYKVKGTMHRILADNPECEGTMDARSEYFTAYLQLRDDIEENIHWTTVVAHEILHITHGELDTFIRDSLLAYLPKDAQEPLKDAYQQHLERHISRLTAIILRYRCWLADHNDPRIDATKGERDRAVERRTLDDVVKALAAEKVASET